MGNRYVSTNAGATPSAPYESWATAAATVATGLAAAAAGEIVYVDAALTDSVSANTTFTNNGTNSAPVILVSATWNTTTYSAGARVDASSTYDFYFQDYCIVHGVDFISGDDMFYSGDQKWIFNDCTWGLGGTAATDTVVFYTSDAAIEFHNVTLTFGDAGQGLRVGGGNSWKMYNCSFTGTGLDNFIKLCSDNEPCIFFADNCDFSGMASNSEVIGDLPSTTAGQSSAFYLSNCKLNATGGVVTAESVDAMDTIVEAYNCSNDGEPNSVYVATIWGVCQDSQTIYLDATNQFSLEMTPDTLSKEVYQPLRVMLGEVYADASDTITVEGIIDRASILQDDEFWVEVVYHTTGDLSRGAVKSTRPDPGATPSNLTAGTTGWTGVSGFTDTTEFKVAVDLTGLNGNGPVQVWVHFATNGATTPCYVDSKITVAA